MSTALHKKQLKRVRQFIRRAEKRGYTFDVELKQSLKSDTLSTQKLKNFTPSKLYSQATSAKFGEVMTGEQARKIERSLQGKKSAETRARRDYYKRSNRQAAEEGDSTSFVDIVLREVESLINTYYFSTTQLLSHNAKMLDGVLSTQISTYGRARVARAMEQSPEQAKAIAEEVIFASTDDKLRRAITTFIMIITGEIPTIEQSKQYTDFEDMTDSGYMQNEDKDF